MDSLDIAAVTDYLSQHFLGKTLHTEPLEYELENGALRGLYADRMVWCDMQWSATAMAVNLSVVSNEKIYRTLPDGGNGEMIKDFSSASLFRYELAKRKSTGEITGHMRFVSSTAVAVPAEAMASAVWNMHWADGDLLCKEREIVYRDQPAADGGFRPVTFEADCRLFSRDGLAGYEFKGVCLDVDPATGERTPSESVLPVFTARERGQEK